MTAVIDPPETEVAASVPETPAPPEPPVREPRQGLPDETILLRQVRIFVAICTFAAGLLHVLAAGAHINHHADLGRAFLMVAALQVAWGFLLLLTPSRLFVALGALGTAAAMVIWIISRTKGIGFWSALNAVEPIEWRDTVTMWFQILAIAGAALLLVPKRAHEPAEGKPIEATPVAIMILLAMLGLGVLYAATHNYVHDDGPGHSHGAVSTTDDHSH